VNVERLLPTEEARDLLALTAELARRWLAVAEAVSDLARARP
jgi:hypothetical protein